MININKLYIITMYHFNSYTANTVIQNLNYDKQYLQSQLTSVYEKNSN